MTIIFKALVKKFSASRENGRSFADCALCQYNSHAVGKEWWIHLSSWNFLENILQLKRSIMFNGILPIDLAFEVFYYVNHPENEFLFSFI